MAKLATLLFLFLAAHFKFGFANEPVDPPETDGSSCISLRSGVGDFSYDAFSNDGPEKWGDIKEEYEACKSGQMQSPINLLVDITVTPPFDAPYVEMTRSVLNYQATGSNFQLTCLNEFKECSTITYMGKTWSMLQFHMHSPSEHHVDGKAFPLEAHLVHKADDGSLAVLGILFEIGKHNPFLQKFLDGADKYGQAVLNLPKLFDKKATICSWQGSLTTPPCTEGIQWFISTGIQYASLKQIGTFREYTGDNKTNRPIHGTNGRNISCFHSPSTAEDIPGVL